MGDSTNVILVGGDQGLRQTVAREVSRTLGYQVFDFDQAMLARFGAPLTKVLASQGAAAVALEEKLLAQDLSSTSGMVLAYSEDAYRLNTDEATRRRALVVSLSEDPVEDSNYCLLDRTDPGEATNAVLAFLLPQLKIRTRREARRDPVAVTEINRSVRTIGDLDHVSWSELLEELCEREGVTLKEICGKGRAASISRVRHVACYLLRNMTSLTLAEIGAYLGGRDHTTVLSSVSLVRERVNGGDVEIARMVGEVIAAIRDRSTVPEWVEEIVDPGGDDSPWFRITYTRADGKTFVFDRPMAERPI